MKIKKFLITFFNIIAVSDSIQNTALFSTFLLRSFMEHLDHPDSTVHYSPVQPSTAQYSSLQPSTAQYSPAQPTTAHYSPV